MSRGRVYLSASYARKREIYSWSLQLGRLGFRVASTWHDGPGEADDDVDAPNAGELARKDLAEIRQSDVFVGFTDGHPTRAGHQVELGAALALGLRVVVVGPVEHHFHRHPRVERVDDVSQLWPILGGGS